MKNLLFKELKLCVPAQTWIFCALSMCVCIPSWPSMVAYVYSLAGFMPLFPIAIANRDLLYTSILPVKKRDVVKGKMILICFLELISIIWSIPFAILKRMIGALPGAEYADLGVNLATFGFILIVLAIFNIIFIPWYYKRPDTKNTAAQLVSMLVAMTVMGIISSVFMAVPGLAEFINDFSNLTSVIVQTCILAGGIAIFFGFSALASHIGGKNFQKVDL